MILAQAKLQSTLADVLSATHIGGSLTLGRAMPWNGCVCPTDSNSPDTTAPSSVNN